MNWVSKITILSTYHASMYIQIFQAKYHANGKTYLFFSFKYEQTYYKKTPFVVKTAYT